MISERGTLFSAVLISILFFINFLISGKPLFLFVSSAGLPIILTFIFRIKRYSSRIFYLILIPVLVLVGSILTYIYLFKFMYLNDLTSYIIFQIFVAFFIVYILVFSYSYLKKGRYSKLP